MRRRLRHLFWSVPVETEVDEEIAAHIELQTKRFADAGMTYPEARSRALVRFGDLDHVRDECTTIRHHMEADVRRAERTEELRQDARYAVRTLARSPLFTIVAVLTIAIGVGANTAIFSVVNAVLLRPLPYQNAERTLVLANRYSLTGLDMAAVSAPEYFDFRGQLPSLDGVAAFRPRSVPITGDGSQPEQLTAYVITPNLFRLLGTGPVLGRDFADDEGATGGALVVMLSHALWTRRFGADPAIVGRAVPIGGQSRTVVGVMPPGIRFPNDPVGYAAAPADVWVPNTLEAQRDPKNRGNQNLVVLGRLRTGVSPERLAQDIAAMERRFRTAYPDRYASAGSTNWHVSTTHLRDQMVGAVRPALLLISAAVALVLLIACVNVANLLLARGALRQREMAVRLALGANRWRLCRQLLTESVMLAIAGGVLGTAVAWAGVRLLVSAAPANIPRLHETHIDAAVLVFTLATTIVTGIIVGLFPALQQSRADLRTTLSHGTRGAGDGKARRRVRTSLVVAEVAMALVILNSAGLVARSFAALQRVDAGIKPRGVLSMYLSLPAARYDSAAKVATFYQRLQAQAAALPGISASSGIQPLPMGGDAWSGSFDIENAAAAELQGPHAEFASALPGYFAVMGIPIVQGRDFTARDDAAAPRVVIVDEMLAARYWPHESAIGKRINALESRGEWETVIGVARHVRSGGPQDPGAPQLYAAYLQHPQGMMSVVTRATIAPTALTNDLRGAVRSIDRDLPVSNVRSMDAVVAGATASQRFNMWMLAVFALTALALASIGLFGVMSYLVAQRSREIGIRVALGGQPRDVRRLVVRESVLISLAGLVAGTLITLAISGTLSTLLFGVSATDPLTYATVAALLLAMSAGAAYGPARRATRVDPLVALRE